MEEIKINNYLGHTHEWWAKDFARRMNRLTFGSPDYEKCRKIFAFLCNQIRSEQKADLEIINS